MPPEKLGFKWSGAYPGESRTLQRPSVLAAQKWRDELAKLNPNAVVLAELPYAEAPVSYSPLSSSLWRRGPDGRLIVHIGATSNTAKLKFESKAFRKLFEAKVKALMDTGVIDGVELGDWHVDSPERLLVVQAARRGVGKSGLIILETGHEQPTLSATYINGIVMNGFGKAWTEWFDASVTSTWVETHTRKPNFTVLEGVADPDRSRLYEMRAVTTLALVLGNGFVCFSDSKGHDWYDFWDRTLGLPKGQRYMKDGAVWRLFENGMVIFNPPHNHYLTANFNELRTSEAKSLSLHRLSIQDGDGDIALSKTPKR